MSLNSGSQSSLRKVILLLGILLVGGVIATIIYKTAPKPQRGEEVKKVRLVETTALKRMTLRPSWIGGGEIAAAQRVQLSAQVAGKINWLEPSAVPGATLLKDRKIATIEKQDYLLQVEQQQAAVIQAQATLDLEKGQAQLAKEEYELAKSQLNTQLKNNSLVLREPQIAAAKAGLKTAQANLSLAQLKLERTDIRMPFNGQIITRSINLGSQVNTSNALFDVVATDEFWLEVKVPQAFLTILDTSKPVIITTGNFQREADILHTLIKVDAVDRQAKVLISIKKPLESRSIENNLQGNLSPNNESRTVQSPLLIGSYIDCQLFAHSIADAYVIENKYLKDEGHIWVVNEGKLFKRMPTIVYKSREKTWISKGFEQGDRLLESNLGVVTEGTQVRIASNREQDK